MFPRRNPFAIAAYYLGLFALIPYVGIVLGPVAILLGIAGVAKSRRDPAAKGGGHAWTGIVTGGVGLVVWGGAALGYWVLPFRNPLDLGG